MDGTWSFPSAWIYRGTDKSLVRRGRKQPCKYVRDARDFNNIETRAVTKFFFLAKQGAEGNSSHSNRNINFFAFLVGLRTYQHPHILTRFLTSCQLDVCLYTGSVWRTSLMVVATFLFILSRHLDSRKRRQHKIL